MAFTLVVKVDFRGGLESSLLVAGRSRFLAGLFVEVPVMLVVVVGLLSLDVGHLEIPFLFFRANAIGARVSFEHV